MTIKDLIQYKNITFIPALHGRLEFAVALSRVYDQLQPDAVAVELPPTIRTPVLKAVRRLPFLSVVMYQEKDGRYVYLPIEPQDAGISALTLALEDSIPTFFVDKDIEGYGFNREPMPDPYTVSRLGLATYAQSYRVQTASLAASDVDGQRETTMAHHLQELSRQYKRILFVCGLYHWGRVRELLETPQALPLGRIKRDGVILANLHQDSSREIMSEMPFLCARFVQRSGDIKNENLDRLVLHQELIREGIKKHFKNSKDEVTPAQVSVLGKFARNYALVQGYLTPDLYQLIIAARGAVDDNFAYEVWDSAVDYPWHEEGSALPTVRVRGEDIYLNEKKIRFHRRFKQFRRRLVSVPVKKRKKEKTPGQWKDNWKGDFICSFQPEDVVIEGYGDFLKRKAVQVLSEQNSHTQPFTASMMDGLDIRESIRNWHEQKIYVIENRPARGKVGSVVVIFDEDKNDDYPWCVTWLGEHEQESDMSYYATSVGENVIGPGISRCEYGGFMLTYPPLRVLDIWQDPFFNGARSKPERLLMAAIDYSEEKFVAYIAAKPPPSRMKTLADVCGKKIIYIPIGQFSPVMLKKIRVFHVLDGHDVRAYANEYVF